MKSTMPSREELARSAGDAEEDTMASDGAALETVGAGGLDDGPVETKVVVTGPVDAKRTPAPFRTANLVCQSGGLEYIRESVAPGRGGLPLMGPCCTVEDMEENWRYQH